MSVINGVREYSFLYIVELAIVTGILAQAIAPLLVEIAVRTVLLLPGLGRDPPPRFRPGTTVTHRQSPLMRRPWSTARSIRPLRKPQLYMHAQTN